MSNLGKFQGEPDYAEALYRAMLDGADDETIFDRDTPVAIFIVRHTADELPELADVDCYAVALWESDQGFVHTHQFDTEAQLDNFRTSCESD